MTICSHKDSNKRWDVNETNWIIWHQQPAMVQNCASKHTSVICPPCPWASRAFDSSHNAKPLAVNDL